MCSFYRTARDLTLFCYVEMFLSPCLFFFLLFASIVLSDFWKLKCLFVCLHILSTTLVKYFLSLLPHLLVSNFVFLSLNLNVLGLAIHILFEFVYQSLFKPFCVFLKLFTFVFSLFVSVFVPFCDSFLLVFLSSFVSLFYLKIFDFFSVSPVFYPFSL